MLRRSLERDKDYLFGFRYTPSTSKQEPHQSLRQSDTTVLGCMSRRERLGGGALQNFQRGCTAHLKKFFTDTTTKTGIYLRQQTD